eukprot:GSMAST32.ASY1.ANO1.10.1 assembled CDS
MSNVPNILNFIGGEFTPLLSGKTFLQVTAPASGDHIANVCVSNADDVNIAVEAAQKSLEGWRSLTTMKRAKIMYKFRELVERDADEISRLIVLENGKNFAEARAEVAKGNETVEWACGMPSLLAGRRTEVSRGVTCYDVRDALGVVACIVPFNFPFMVPMWTVPIALTAGNCVILKPTGIPPGVFQIVHGTRDAVEAVTFVGSSLVAKLVSQRCSKLNKRVMAMGGAKNHLVALEDCDAEGAARDIVASFAGCAGQRCMAASLLTNVVQRAQALQLGQEKGQVGPVIDATSRAPISRGAKVLVDGRKMAQTNPGTWVGPTILLHQTHDDEAVRSEIFGPVLSVVRVKTWQDAIDIENSSPYGNAASIYTSIGAHAEWFSPRFRAGMIGVNIGVPVPREPFSFGGHALSTSKYGSFDVTGDGAMEFFTTRRKVTSKWTKIVVDSTDHANFAGQM